MDALKKLTETVWVGGLLMIAGFMSWIMMFDRSQGGIFAGRLFPAIAAVGMVAGAILLFYHLYKVGLRALQALPFWLAILMWLLAFAAWFGVGHLLGLLGLRADFAAWHGISMLLYLVQCVLGILLVLRG